MPQRFLRPGITTSDNWNSCSFEAQSFYIRILTLVDDFGRFDGRIPILHGQCFALRPDIKSQRTAALRSELHESGLIQVYVVEGKEFIQILKWSERARSDKSKFPDPPEYNHVPQHSAADGSEALLPSSSPSPSPSSSPYDQEFDKFWSAYPKKIAKGKAQEAWRKTNAKLEAVLPAIAKARASEDWKKENGRFIPYPATWLNGKRWEDEISIPAIIIPNMPDTRPEDVFGALKAMAPKEE